VGKFLEQIYLLRAIKEEILRKKRTNNKWINPAIKLKINYFYLSNYLHRNLKSVYQKIDQTLKKHVR